MHNYTIILYTEPNETSVEASRMISGMSFFSGSLLLDFAVEPECFFFFGLDKYLYPSLKCYFFRQGKALPQSTCQFSNHFSQNTFADLIK